MQVTNLNLTLERLLWCCQREEEEAEVVVEGELLQEWWEQRQAQEEEGEAAVVEEVEYWFGAEVLEQRDEESAQKHSNTTMRQWKLCGCVPAALLSSEKEGSSGMLCVGPDGAKPGPRSAL